MCLYNIEFCERLKVQQKILNLNKLIKLTKVINYLGNSWSSQVTTTSITIGLGQTLLHIITKHSIFVFIKPLRTSLENVEPLMHYPFNVRMLLKNTTATTLVYRHRVGLHHDTFFTSVISA